MPPKISVKLGAKSKRTTDTTAKPQQVLIDMTKSLPDPIIFCPLRVQSHCLQASAEAAPKRARRTNSRKRFREEEGYEESEVHCPLHAAPQTTHNTFHLGCCQLSTLSAPMYSLCYQPHLALCMVASSQPGCTLDSPECTHQIMITTGALLACRPHNKAKSSLLCRSP